MTGPAFPVVTGLKVLKNYVYADVTLGWLPDQGRVTTAVRVSLSDKEVADQVQPLLDLLAQRAHGVVRNADLTEQIEAGVREELKVVVEDERARIQGNNARALERAIDSLRASAGRTEGYGKQTLENALASLEALTGRE